MNTDTHTEKTLLEFSTKDEQTSSASRSLIRGYHLRPRCGVDKTLSQSARSPLLKVESLTLSGGGRLAHVLIFAVDNRSLIPSPGGIHLGNASPWATAPTAAQGGRRRGWVSNLFFYFSSVAPSNSRHVSVSSTGVNPLRRAVPP